MALNQEPDISKPSAKPALTEQENPTASPQKEENRAQIAASEAAGRLINRLGAEIAAISQQISSVSSEPELVALKNQYDGLVQRIQMAASGFQSLSAVALNFLMKRKINQAMNDVRGDINYGGLSDMDAFEHQRRLTMPEINKIEAIVSTVDENALKELAEFLLSISEKLITTKHELENLKQENLDKELAEWLSSMKDMLESAQDSMGGFAESLGKNKDKGLSQGSSAKETLIEMFKSVNAKRAAIGERIGIEIDELGGMLSSLIGHLSGQSQEKFLEELNEIEKDLDIGGEATIKRDIANEKTDAISALTKTHDQGVKIEGLGEVGGDILNKLDDASNDTVKGIRREDLQSKDGTPEAQSKEAEQKLGQMSPTHVKSLEKGGGGMGGMGL